ncbi:hypothetical protein EBU58_00935 [bacterium]|nr:hypothetical protein [bacterium]
MCPSPDSAASGDGAAEVSVVVNGESLRMPAASAVTDLLERLGLAGRPLAVEINRTVVPRRLLAPLRRFFRAAGWVSYDRG